ncbi:protein WHAT'S THIS FACTOR 9, mitochondrial [Salvia miltiorrhiza]|uniref:protein WHAT'S THIS FACTOR 9, mitochondrial n=1 Tax=Salvia miltiorrhiza TaxID=226208 RepID=UPI0025AD5BF8|nr:protein WHAT'S THIS FACTOR 9, mitochondrial [Salvia miltiorrhiza]
MNLKYIFHKFPTAAANAQVQCNMHNRCSYVLHFATARFRLRLRHVRTFINARIKWVRDPYLDAAVEREKNLKSLHSLKNLILSHPSQSLPLSAISPLKPHLGLPTTADKFIDNYPFIFKIFLPPNRTNPFPHVKITPKALSVHYDELLHLNMSHYRTDVAQRLAKLLMIARAGKLPLHLIDIFGYDLGLPHDYLLTLLPEFPDYFQICDLGFRDSNGEIVFGLELVNWRNDLAISEMEKRGESGMQMKYSMNLPRGFDLQKRVQEWVEEWQNLPYISPYENAFHLSPNSDHAERWTVGVIHEVLSLLVTKKTERENVFRLGEFLGLGRVRMKKALVHFPAIFYVSNKIRTQTVVLREAYRKKLMMEKHPLMAIRNRYVSLMELVLRRGRPVRGAAVRRRERGKTCLRVVTNRKEDSNRWRRSDDDDDDDDDD